MLPSSLDRVSTLTHFTPHVFMPFQFPISHCVDGDPFFQQNENHLADRVDLIGIGVFYHLLTFMSIGFFANTLQERTLSALSFHTFQRTGQRMFPFSYTSCPSLMCNRYWRRFSEHHEDHYLVASFFMFFVSFCELAW